jgi:hypothetical protein
MAPIAFVHQHTDIPTAKVIAHDSNQNDLGLEWILMELISGDILDNHWKKTMSWTAKEDWSRLALHSAQLYWKQFPRTGNLFHNCECPGEHRDPVLTF